MICSLNEIRATLQKAAVGSGLPTGTADDLASAGVWLCAHDLDGFRAVLSVMSIEPSHRITRPEHGASFNLTGETVGQHGASPFQLLIAGDVETVEVIDVGPETCILLVGLAAVAAEAVEPGFVLSSKAIEPIVVTSQGLRTIERLPAAGLDQIVIRVNDDEDHQQPDDFEPPHGVEVDEQSWMTANQLAAKTYVAATEQSRLRGAGAGLTDND